MQRLGDPQIECRRANAAARKADARQTVRDGWLGSLRIAPALPTLGIGLLPAPLDFLKLGGEDLRKRKSRPRSRLFPVRPSSMPEPSNIVLFQQSGIRHPIAQADVQQRHERHQHRCTLTAHVGRGRGRRDRHGGRHTHLRIDLLHRLAPAVPGAGTADETFAEDEEVAITIPQVDVLAALQVEGRVDEMVRCRGPSLVAGHLIKVEILLDSDVALRIPSDEERRGQTVAVQAMNRRQVHVNRDPESEPEPEGQKCDKDRLWPHDGLGQLFLHAPQSCHFQSALWPQHDLGNQIIV